MRFNDVAPFELVENCSLKGPGANANYGHTTNLSMIQLFNIKGLMFGNKYFDTVEMLPLRVHHIQRVSLYLRLGVKWQLFALQSGELDEGNFSNDDSNSHGTHSLCKHRSLTKKWRQFCLTITTSFTGAHTQTTS